uniref:Uncharacterized protein n=1 Tax=Amphilophus citrinellus TaxID=61819 RepID=A0A3Q0SAQ8_AMPCI
MFLDCGRKPTQTWGTYTQKGPGQVEDVNVTFEDQQKINKFARNTSRMTELKNEILEKKVSTSGMGLSKMTKPPGIKPPTFRLVDDLLYLLSHLPRE